jgi:hypothetical protein
VVVGEHAAEVDGGWFDIHVGILAWIRGMSIPPFAFRRPRYMRVGTNGGGVDSPIHLCPPHARTHAHAHHAHAHASCASRARTRIMREAT